MKHLTLFALMLSLSVIGVIGQERVAQIKVKSANLHAVPNLNSKIIDELSQNARLVVHRKEGNWLLVQTGGDIGWIHENAIEHIGDNVDITNRNVNKNFFVKEQSQFKYYFNPDNVSLANNGLLTSSLEARPIAKTLAKDEKKVREMARDNPGGILSSINPDDEVLLISKREDFEVNCISKSFRHSETNEFFTQRVFGTRKEYANAEFVKSSLKNPVFEYIVDLTCNVTYPPKNFPRPPRRRSNTTVKPPLNYKTDDHLVKNPETDTWIFFKYETYGGSHYFNPSRVHPLSSSNKRILSIRIVRIL